MTEQQLAVVLSRRFGIFEGLLRNVESPDFPRQVLEEIGRQQGYLLMIIVYDYKQDGLCETEQRLVDEAERLWKDRVMLSFIRLIKSEVTVRV